MSGLLGASPIRWRPALRGSVAILLALALAPLLLELHSTAEEHSALDRPTEVFTDASHPSLPAHVEPSASQARERCTYCVLQLQSLGRLAQSPVPASRPSCRLFRRPARWHAPGYSAPVNASPRAPPASATA